MAKTVLVLFAFIARSMSHLSRGRKDLASGDPPMFPRMVEHEVSVVIDVEETSTQGVRVQTDSDRLAADDRGCGQPGRADRCEAVRAPCRQPRLKMFDELFQHHFRRN